MDIVFKTEEAIFNFRVAGIWIENGHVLIHRAVYDTSWSLPGGRVAMLEDSKESIIRELQEELGIDIEVEKLLWSAENFFEYDDQSFHEIGFYYKISSKQAGNYFREDEFHGKEGERLIYKWVPIEALEQMELYPVFLRTDLKNIPEYPQHIVARQ